MSDCLIYAGIVSFNPNIVRLKENIDSIVYQVEEVVVYDNGSDNQDKVKKLLCNYDRVHMICADKNNGIAAALNSLMQWGFDRHYKWMLSLDQDSVCGQDFIVSMLSYLSIEPRIGVAAPVIVDRNIGVVGHNPEQDYAHVRTCITSGSIVNIDIWQEIGGYDESMFIDSVDFEFCYRVRKNGYGVIQTKNVQLLHELGNSNKRRFVFLIVNVNGHSAFRKYYIARNNVYYPLKHHLPLHFIRGNFRNLWIIILILLYEDSKHEKIEAVTKGWKVAFKGEQR